MKFLKFLLFSSVLISCTATNFTNKQVYLDERGNQVNSEEFQSRWRNPEILYTRWDYKTDTARIATLSHPTYQRLEVTYPSFKNNLEKITGKEIPENTIFLLQYIYADDLCSPKSTNNWNKSMVTERKSFLSPKKAELELSHPNLLYLNFFEESIILKNDPTSPEEYFFSDKENFLQNSLFQNPSFCGSFALVKPNGQVLIRNGENTVDGMAKHLDPEIWNQLFAQAREN